MHIPKMQKKIERKGFVVQVNASELFALNSLY